MSGRIHKQPFAQVPEQVIYAEVSDRAVRLFAILDRHGDGDGKAFPGRPRLAEFLRCSIDSIDRAMTELRDAGLVHVEARFRENGGRSTNDYWLFPALPPGRTHAASPPRTDAATPGRTHAASKKNESHKEREPQREHLALVSAEDSKKPKIDPVADKLARDEWERRKTRGVTLPMGGFLPFRLRVTEALAAGYTPQQIAAALPRMSTFTRGSFENAMTRPTPAQASRKRIYGPEEESGAW